MKFKDKWMACVSLGEQTFRTEISDQLSSVKTLLLLFFLFFNIYFIIIYERLILGSYGMHIKVCTVNFSTLEGDLKKLLQRLIHKSEVNLGTRERIELMEENY